MRICIYSSELAVVTGHNNSYDVGEIILKLWQKNFPDDYDEILKERGLVEESKDEFIERVF